MLIIAYIHMCVYKKCRSFVVCSSAFCKCVAKFLKNCHITLTTPCMLSGVLCYSKSAQNRCLLLSNIFVVMDNNYDWDVTFPQDVGFPCNESWHLHTTCMVVVIRAIELVIFYVKNQCSPNLFTEMETSM